MDEQLPCKILLYVGKIMGKQFVITQVVTIRITHALSDGMQFIDACVTNLPWLLTACLILDL